MPFALCPSCRSMQRGAALRCWKCGIDLTNAQAEIAAAAAARASEPAAAHFAPAPALGEDPGPAPWGFLRRMFDPRMPQAELDRAARFGSLLPWIETYRKPAAVSLLVPFVIFLLLRRVLGYMGEMQFFSLPHDASFDAYFNWMIVLAEILFWANIGVLYAAWELYQGSEAAIWAGAFVWLVAGALPLWITTQFGVFNLAVFTLNVFFLYVPFVLLWKTARVHAARAEFVRRDAERHLA